MENFQKIKVGGKEYIIVDSIQNFRAEDSFIHNRNKLTIFTGSGEARKYVGSYSGENGEKLSNFFEYQHWGNTKVNGERTYPVIQKNTCFFSKSNLQKYLSDAEIEYQNQEQVYHNDISEYFSENLEAVNSLASDKIFFSIYDVSDFIGGNLNRGYIRSDDEIWDLWRRLVLPKISYLSILKLVSTTGNNDSKKPLFYFRILLDYQFRSIVHPTLISPSSEVIDSKENKKDPSAVTGRPGADVFRKKVIDHMPQCPFTKISDERILIASHIKPYNICIKEGREDQANDHLNALALTPTYDKLFDQGYITFTDSGDLLCGTQLTPYTWEKLNINPNAKNTLRIYPDDRNEYLEYHRLNVFQDDINDLIL